MLSFHVLSFPYPIWINPELFKLATIWIKSFKIPEGILDND